MRLRENGFLFSIYLLGFWDSSFPGDLFQSAQAREAGARGACRVVRLAACGAGAGSTGHPVPPVPSGLSAELPLPLRPVAWWAPSAMAAVLTRR